MALDRASLLLLVLVTEAVVGYPHAVYRVVRHPVVWIGALISTFEVRMNRGSERMRRVAGCALLIVLIAVSTIAGWVLERAGDAWPLGMIGVLLAGTTMLAQRSLYDHVAAVLRPLQSGRLEEARREVSRIVGRDTAALDAAGVSTAAIESVAESFCDGIVAPAFWFLIGGLPGLFICKAINTADSMVGHKDERHRAFGWAAARADDLVNLIPARIAGLLICIAGLGGWRTMVRDAPLHASPNGGWPEAAMAGVLARQLGGPVAYSGELAFRAHLGAGPRPDATSLRAALNVYWRACILMWLTVAGLAWLS
ncbi:MAG TPA: adenosylcobinamide-phosphate synthase CbiB [Steroidobacteraceae bacterium]|nr:adenosylcobinamide-phosphate synthase CbiB [Steroidobacteraceae bacterium]